MACGQDEPTIVRHTSGGAAGADASPSEAGARPTTHAGAGGDAGAESGFAGVAGTAAGVAGAAGAPGTAGTTGSAGSPALAECGPAPVASLDEPLIDDISDTSGLLPENGGRHGTWFSFSDGSAEVTMSVVSPGADASGHAVHATGGPFTSWGAGFGFPLFAEDGAPSCAYDVSAFNGIRFAARGEGEFRVSVQTMDVIPTTRGGSCTTGCWDSHTASFTASEEWTVFELPFTALEQRGYGTRVPFDPARASAIQFEVNTNASFDLWVDDIVLASDLGEPELPPVPDDAPYLDSTRSVDERLADLLSRMSLREMVAQMAQAEQESVTEGDVTRLALGSVLSGGDATATPGTAEGWADLVDSFQAAAKATRLHIPLLYGLDAVHGNSKILGGTVFPHNIGMGATRDAALSEQEGTITATELAASGLRWTFAPCVAVARDQRWGRTYESFGEHPEVASLMATYVSGLQGTPVPVLGTAKHYLADGGAVWGTNETGTGIDQGDAIMSESALRAIHLPPYPASIDLGVGSVMTSFSSWNGGKLHGSRYLVNGVLKGELGFGGFVVSDWDGIKQLPGSFADQVRVAVQAGIDMFMLPQDYVRFIDTLVSQVNDGQVPESRVRDAAARILRKKFELGLFENPLAYRSLLPTVGSAEHRAVARQAVRQSLVLLNNTDAFLPLAPTTSVCVNGSAADDLIAQAGGWTLGWQSPAQAPQGTTIRQAIIDQVGAERVVETGCDVGVRVVRERARTYAEGAGDDADPQHDDSGSCTASQGCVVVIVAGRTVDIQEILSDPSTRALVMAWYPGSEGAGVADALYDVDGQGFTGTLPVTWKIDDHNEPVTYCSESPLDTRTELVMCGDVGEHYSDLANPPPSVLFPYGFGLAR